MTDIKPCKCDKPSEYLEVHKFSTGTEFFVICMHCRKFGDTKETAEEAITAWNKRVEP
jgi:hypothetical protein